MRLPRSSAMFAAAALITPRVVALVAPRVVSAAARAAPRAALPLVRALSAKVRKRAPRGVLCPRGFEHLIRVDCLIVNSRWKKIISLVYRLHHL
jgi:hypothetical protein